MVKNMSEHFSFYEMTMTMHRKYLELNREAVGDNSLMAAGIELCKTLLEPIREHYQSPVIVHSGYRCSLLNLAVGGSEFSQHQHFQAADFHIIGVTLVDIFDWIYKESDLEFGQLILEGWVVGLPTWIHISLGKPFRKEQRCGEVLMMVEGRYRRIN